jgi:hypothetical protein
LRCTSKNYCFLA